jgi:hypothetical protein
MLCAVLASAVLGLAPLPAIPQAAREATVDAETRARIVLQTRLSSKLNEVGDHVTAVLDEPIYVNGLLVVPRGTEFHGRVTAVKAAGRAMKSGHMALIFDRVAMPWGEEPASVVVTAIDDWVMDKKLKADEEGKVKGGKNGGKAADNVERGGQIGGLGAATVILTGAAVGAGPAVYGAGAASIAGGMVAGLLLTKGGDIRVEPGAVFRIKFVKPMTLPVIQQPGLIPKPIKQDEPPEKEPPVKEPLVKDPPAKATIPPAQG